MGSVIPSHSLITYKWANEQCFTFILAIIMQQALVPISEVHVQQLYIARKLHGPYIMHIIQLDQPEAWIQELGQKVHLYYIVSEISKLIKNYIFSPRINFPQISYNEVFVEIPFSDQCGLTHPITTKSHIYNYYTSFKQKKIESYKTTSLRSPFSISRGASN